MTEEGVNGLSLAEVARRLGVQPPSIYKYFPSFMAVYDALFLRGQAEHLAIMRTAMAEADPGLPVLIHGLEAGDRWALANRALAQLLFWRPVPSFEPSAAAFAVSVEMVALQRAALADAAAAGQLGPAADSDEAIAAQVIAHPVDVPTGGAQQPLHPIRGHRLGAALPPATARGRRFCDPVTEETTPDEARETGGA